MYLIDDNDLVVTMASRLGQVESELLSARREIIEKDQHIRYNISEESSLMVGYISRNGSRLGNLLLDGSYSWMLKLKEQIF